MLRVYEIYHSMNPYVGSKYKLRCNPKKRLASLELVSLLECYTNDVLIKLIARVYE